MQDRAQRAAGSPGPSHLSSVLLGTAAAIGGTKAETLGAALGVAGIQRKCPQAALVTPRALHIFLEEKQSSSVPAASHKALAEDRDSSMSDQSTMM